MLILVAQKAANGQTSSVGREPTEDSTTLLYHEMIPHVFGFAGRPPDQDDRWGWPF